MMKSRPADVGLPERIVVTRSFTYEVEWAMEDLEHEDIEVTEDNLYALIQRHVDEDMTSPLSRHEIIWTDENGDYIND
jgi:hypothetical protein